MELSMWYVKERYKENNRKLDYMPGEIIPTQQIN